MWWIVLIIGIMVFNWVVITMIVDGILMGMLIPRYYKKVDKKQFMIEKKNRIDIQEGVKCSAFSSAYVLRHFGVEARGDELYEEMPYKMKDGYVYPKAIPKVLLRYGIKVKYCRGNINSLKCEVGKGNPVIVLIRYNGDNNWLHYVPVVGFDEQKVYIAESLKEFVNCDNEYYNRGVSVEEFRKLWNTSRLKMPFYKYTYFSVEESNRIKTQI